MEEKIWTEQVNFKPEVKDCGVMASKSDEVVCESGEE